jgi:stearoyl-CoA desaturase (delta-9 desaturase)
MPNLTLVTVARQPIFDTMSFPSAAADGQRNPIGQPHLPRTQSSTLLTRNKDRSMSSSPAPGSPSTFPRKRFDWSNADWKVILGIASMHLGAILAPFHFTWTALVVFALFTWISGGIGITLGFHRLLTHRSFAAPKWLEYFLTICGCLSWQGGPIQWVGTHRLHHAHSDEELDPHTPKHGFTWSHVFWCMHRDNTHRPPRQAAKDMLRDPVHVLIDRWFWVFQFALIPVLYFGGELAAKAGVSASGLSWLAWGLFLRTVVVYHGTWFVNSAAHTWGYRNFQTTDLSTNVWWVALLSFGEGWHNNHHAFQRSAAHGLRWWEFDLTYQTIRLLGKLGLAWDIVRPTEEQIVHKKQRKAPPAPAIALPTVAALNPADSLAAAD